MQKSYWQTTAELPEFPALRRQGKVDVVIVGGGITGITAAYLLKRAGKTVALLERDRCVAGDTAHTTAHLTCVTDLPLVELVQRFGRDDGRAVWDAGLAAIQAIEEIVAAEKIACAFRRVPGYRHAPFINPPADAANRLRDEAALAADLGFDAAFLESIPLLDRPGWRIANQAKFHPLQYLAKLLATIPGDGSQVYEQSEATEFKEDPLTVTANSHPLECEHVIIATHVPLTGNTSLASATLFQSKLAPYSSYAVGARAAAGSLPEACFWDTSDPYFYLRVDRQEKFDYVIYGGKDHKTGQAGNTDPIYAALEASLASLPFFAQPDTRWSGQVVETNDGLPFIGNMTPRQFIATGFSGNGMTFGTLAGMMACDHVLGRANPWAALFDPHRKKIHGGTWDYVKENLDCPYYLVRDRIARSEGDSVDAVARNEGKVLRLEGKRVLVYRNPHGKIVKLSPSCTHLGCIVHWNTAERTWDCPCHGSRFKPTGEVLAGPAETSLEPIPDDPKK